MWGTAGISFIRSCRRSLVSEHVDCGNHFAAVFCEKSEGHDMPHEGQWCWTILTWREVVYEDRQDGQDYVSVKSIGQAS